MSWILYLLSGQSEIVLLPCMRVILICILACQIHEADETGQRRSLNGQIPRGRGTIVQGCVRLQEMQEHNSGPGHEGAGKAGQMQEMRKHRLKNQAKEISF